ncbi:extensin [Scaptodrosophila lebanonensis]|uniref:Extensin n=1 Tax=Drosophila lebanonensis TaxID=7225 RepID=A0A6J2TG18_DROLE|nr:extensin [Scaptodrosophila lebanonensis]
MAHNFVCSLVVLSIVATAVQAEPARFRSRSSRLQLARQEAAPPAPIDPPQDAPAEAPYPPAGVTPAVPFDLPTETEAQPDLTYGPPDNTYGPPAEDLAPQPDNTYGPPDAVDADQDPAPTADTADPMAQNLIQPRNSRLRSRRPVPEKLRAVEIIKAKPVFIYAL